MTLTNPIGAPPETADVHALVSEHPYRLTEVRGIGFHLADTAALWLGTPLEGPERLRAALLHALDQSALSGHCYLPEQALLRHAADLTGQDQHKVARELDATAHVTVELLPHLGRETAVVFSRRLHAAETNLARQCTRPRNRPCAWR